MKVEGKRILVVGLGKSGQAAVRFLCSRNAIVTAIDKKPSGQSDELSETLSKLGADVYWGNHPMQLFTAQDLIVPSPGVPWNLPELQEARIKGVSVAGELEIASDYLSGRVLGVTGTNGKTTTTALIGHILKVAGQKVAVGGNIGRPVLSMIESATAEMWNVLELSSFQLEATTSFRSDIGVVLNITPDHLDRHGTFESYRKAKYRIVANQTSEDVLIVNRDDEICRGFADSAHSRVTWFSRTLCLNEGVCSRNGLIFCDGVRVTEDQLPIRGKHNLENALAAVAACRRIGIKLPQIAKGLQSFRPVEHRLEFVRKCNGIEYYNDSKATNVDAAVKSIESFDGRVWVILGGKDKDSDYLPLRAALNSKTQVGLLIGASAQKIKEQLGNSVEVRDLETLEKAVIYAHKNAQPGDTVLLAPACASFDQFASYEERGTCFKNLVAML